MRKIAVFFVIVAAILIAPIAYLKWWPTACQFEPEKILEISGTSLVVEDVSKSCSMFDGGRQWLQVTNIATRESIKIIEWFNLTDEYDAFFMDGKLHIIIVDDTKITESHSSSLGTDVIYHWISLEKFREDKDYLRWLDSPHNPQSRKWALEHSEIR